MIIKFLVLVTVIATAVLCFGFAINAQTTDGQTLITQLQTQIANLMAQLQTLQSQPSPGVAQTWCYTFKTNLGFAQSGTIDVVNLHSALQKQGISYSPDNTNVYSAGTSQAVIKFQTKYGISPQSGYVGTLTRAKLNALYGCSASQASTTSSPIASTITASSGIPATWDWRNVMGQNWDTPVKDQGLAGNCWDFSSLANMESQINLYYGKHLDVDLSEQELADCMPVNNQQITQLSNLYYSWPPTDKKAMIVDDKCDPYSQREPGPNCDTNHICSDWQNRFWENSDYMYYYTSASAPNYPWKFTMLNNSDDIKEIIITQGPLMATSMSMNHALLLVGYNGNSDWTSVNYCNGRNNEICTSTGCIPNTCSKEGDIMKHCVYDTSLNMSGPETYTCTSGKWDAHSSVCPSGQTCVETSIGNPQCLPKSTVLSKGYKGCFNAPFDGSRFYMKYSPGQGDTSWIFKNSYGTNRGDGGYVAINLPASDITTLYTFIGPFTPPTDKSYWPAGFTNTPSPWFYKQTCNNPGNSGNYTVKMGFQNGQQTTSSASCQTGQVCQSSDSFGFINCVGVCTPNWSCGQWSACINDSQTRTCTDANNCGATSGEPATRQSCAVQKTITVTSPSTGTYSSGQQLNIAWNSTKINNVSIILFKNNSNKSWIISNSVSASQKSYAWTIPSNDPTITTGSDYIVKIWDATNLSPLGLSDPFTITSSIVPPINMIYDVDGNGSVNYGTDGTLLLRYLFSPSGSFQVDDILGQGATRTSAANIKIYLDCLKNQNLLDADGNGKSDALTDGVLISRYMQGYTGTQLTNGALGSGTTRTTADSIISFLNGTTATSCSTSYNVSQSSLASISSALQGIIQEIQKLLNHN